MNALSEVRLSSEVLQSDVAKLCITENYKNTVIHNVDTRMIDPPSIAYQGGVIRKVFE